MKKLLLGFTFLASSLSSIAQMFPLDTLQNKGRRDNRINFVILPDGFTASEQAFFVKKADTINQMVFSYHPLKQYQNFFNSYCIRVPSAESGVNHPATATDVTEVDPVMVVDNYFGSTFDNGGTHRALVVGKPAVAASVLASNLPDYDICLVLSNTEMYGGTGGKYATGTLNKYAVKIAVHELGHSFAGLADEYWAGTYFAKEKPNMTAVTNPATVKWKNWLGYKSVGIYPYGTTSPASAWYRPHQDCMMRYLDTVLCPVCQQTFIDEIYNLVNPIDSVSISKTAMKSALKDSVMITLNQLVKPNPNTLKVEWFVKGSLVATGDTMLKVYSDTALSPSFDVNLVVTDTTALSRSFWPKKGYQFSKTFTINVEKLGIKTIHDLGLSKFFYTVYPNPTVNHFYLSYEYSGTTEIAQLSVVDILGKKLIDKQVNILQGKHELALDLSQLSAGTYFVQLNGQRVHVATKVQKNE